MGERPQPFWPIDAAVADVFTPEQRQFLDCQRVARLATADENAAPHVVPVCYAITDDTAYITIDEKPKRVPARSLKRLRNIAANPHVAVVADHYDDSDWSRLGWVMMRGPAEIIEAGEEHALAQAFLKQRYRQLAEMNLTAQPVIAVRIETVSSWGNLDPE